MAEQPIEERYAHCGPRRMEQRLDALRRRANILGGRIAAQKQYPGDELEHAALMWAIAELTGIGDEVRLRNEEREARKVGARRDATKRAEHAEALNAQFRVTNAALKAENHRLRMLLEPPRNADSVARSVGVSTDGPRATDPRSDASIR